MNCLFNLPLDEFQQEELSKNTPESSIIFSFFLISADKKLIHNLIFN
jgi:hypothetical protein